MQGEWVDGLVHWPTRAEQEKQENARRRNLMQQECERLGIAVEQALECLKAANVGAEFVKAWEAK